MRRRILAVILLTVALCPPAHGQPHDPAANIASRAILIGTRIREWQCNALPTEAARGVCVEAAIDSVYPVGFSELLGHDHEKAR